MRSKYIAVIPLLFAVGVLLISGCLVTTQESTASQENMPEIIIGSDDFPPFNYSNENAGDPTGSHGFTVHDIPSFKIKFRMTDYTEKEFDVDKKAFKNIKKGDSGVLTYQGCRYLGFIKD